MMTPYLAFGRAAFQRQLTYRTANWAGLFANLFFLFFRAYALRACFAHRTDIGGLDAMQVVTYITVTQSLLMVCPQWGLLDLASSVHSGQIAVDLLRPVDLFGMVAARRLAASVYYVAARMVPLLAIGAGFGLLELPADLSIWGPFVVSTVLAAWIGICLLFVVEVSSFWLESEQGVRFVMIGLSVVPSGLMVPLQWLPGWLEQLCWLTPFVHSLYTPSQVWLGVFDGPTLLAALGGQLAWAITLTVACRALLRAGTRRLQVLGG